MPESCPCATSTADSGPRRWNETQRPTSQPRDALPMVDVATGQLDNLGFGVHGFVLECWACGRVVDL